MIVKSYTAQRNSIDSMLSDIKEFVLNSNRTQKDIAEYELLSEEILIKLIEASKPSEELTISFKKQMSHFDVIISCKGNPIYLDEECDDFGSRIIMDYSERITHTRKHGVNQVTISLGTTTDSIIKHMNITGLSAILTSLLICLFLDSSHINWLAQQVFNPIMILFTKLMKNVATPVAFFSLLSYVINFHTSYEFNGGMKKIAIKYVISSVIATVIPFTAIILLGAHITSDISGNIGRFSLHAEETIYILGKSLEEIINNLVPKNLMDVFTNSNPLPMLLIAALFGIVINSYDGKNNNKVRDGISAIDDLLSRIVTFVFSLLPFFLYIAIVGLTIQNFTTHRLSYVINGMLYVTAFIFAMLIIQCVLYMIELKLSGISIKSFIIKYKDILIENFKIGSNVDALPYNIRMFRRKLNNPNKESSIRSLLNLGTKVNMDGNCVIITTTIMLFCLSMDFNADFLFILEILIIILLLGIGSPNQPGSFTIAMLVLIGFLKLSDNLCYCLVVFESIFFRFYSTINAFGDIVTIVTIEDDELTQKKKKVIL